MGSVNEYKCPKCNAPVDPNGQTCKYCGTQYVIKNGEVTDLLNVPATGENTAPEVREEKHISIPVWAILLALVAILALYLWWRFS